MGKMVQTREEFLTVRAVWRAAGRVVWRGYGVFIPGDIQTPATQSHGQSAVSDTGAGLENLKRSLPA